MLDERTLVFSDDTGNRQLLTTGHLGRDPRVALFLIDDPGRRCLKIDGRAMVVVAHGERAQVEEPLRAAGSPPS